MEVEMSDDLTRGDGPKAHSESAAESGDEAHSAQGEEQEESQKSYRTILEQEITAGLHELERPAGSLAMSALSAGLDIGFSVLLMAAMLHLTDGVLPGPVVDVLVANMYSVGFIFVIFGRSELFTEHTTLAFLPILDGRASVAQLARLWGIVYAANLAGIALFSAVLAWFAPRMGIADAAAFDHIALRMTAPPWWLALPSAILAGWLMGLLSWLVTAGRDTVSQIFFVWLVTAAIGFAGLHHCILGSGEVLTALFAGDAVDWGDYGRFLLVATAGNALGGTFFVGLIKYGHASPRTGGRSFERYERPGATRPRRAR
jgi:formate-nitrite transporter family protein